MLMISKTRGGAGESRLTFLRKVVATMRKMVVGNTKRETLIGDGLTRTWTYLHLAPFKVISSLTSRFELEIETTALRILSKFSDSWRTPHHKKNSKLRA
jgi:hypothetical protein